MSDLLDYLPIFSLSLLLVVLKFTHVIEWEWWVTALPAILAVCFHLLVKISENR